MWLGCVLRLARFTHSIDVDSRTNTHIQALRAVANRVPADLQQQFDKYKGGASMWNMYSVSNLRATVCLLFVKVTWWSSSLVGGWVAGQFYSIWNFLVRQRRAQSIYWLQLLTGKWFNVCLCEIKAKRILTLEFLWCSFWGTLLNTYKFPLLLGVFNLFLIITN